MKCRYWAILMCLQLSIVSNVYAQPAQESPPAQESAAGGDVRVTKAPKLIREVQAEYPEAAIEARVEGRVVLQLELDALGAVKNVEVLEGPGYGLNEAAAEAARQFEFEPAEVNGQPSAVSFTFAINFSLPILPGDFVGTVVDPETGEGIEGAVVMIRYTGSEYGDEPIEATTTTDEEGLFYFGNVPPGNYSVSLKLNEYRDFETDIDLVPGEVVEVEYKVSAEAENLTGQIREAGTRNLLAGVEVEVVGIDDEDETPIRTGFTDGDGRFAFRGLLPGKYFVRARSTGYLSTAFEVEVRANEATDGTYYIEAEYYDEYTIRTTAKRPQSEMSRQTLTLEEVRRVPGTGGDVVRVIQNLPGVARASFVSGLIVVRGSAPQDTKVFLQGDYVPLIYHFLGGPAIVNTEMVESIDFYPGNFSTYYGRSTAGVIDLRTRSPRNDRFHGMIEVDLLDSSVVLEGPVSENFSIAVSARRSYFDLFLPYVLPKDGPDVLVAPRYYDYQAWITYRGFKDSLVEVFFYGSDDGLEVLLPKGEPQGNQDLQITNIGLKNSFHRGQLRWEWMPSHLPIKNTLMASFGENVAAFDAAEDLFFDLTYYQSQIREDLRLQLSEGLALRLGADFILGNATYRYSTPRIGSSPDAVSSQGMGMPSISPDGYVGNRKTSEMLPAYYVEAEYRPIKDWLIVPGVRADYYGPIRQTSISPRISSRYALTPAVTVKGGVGLFTQPPVPGQATEVFGNPDITYEKTMQYALGAEWKPVDYFEVDSTLFYRDMRNLVTSSQGFKDGDEPGERVPEIYNNDGRGRAYGMELLLRHLPRNRFFGWLGYTLSRSERLNLDTGEYDVYRYDQTHILTLVAGYNLPWNFDISGRFRLVTGNPYTPIEGGVFDSDQNRYRPIYGPRNSERSATFHQLDLRIDRRFVFDTWVLGVYLDVSNVYWADNAEGVRHNYDYTDSEPINGLPILPTIGVNAKF